MQFDEKDFEKNNNDDFSLEDDSNAISWDDLLSSDGDINLDDLIKSNPDNDTKQNDAPPSDASSIADFDISSLADNDDIIQNEENINITESVELSSNEAEIPPKKEENDDFDLSAAAETYVNSIEPDEAGVESENIDIIKDKSDISENEIDMNDVLDSIPDDADADSKKEDLSDIVDEELLELLDVKGNKDDIIRSVNIASSSDKENIENNDNDTDLLSDLDLLADNDETGTDDIAPVKSDVADSTGDEEYTPEEDVQERKKSFPVILIAAAVCAVIVFAGIIAFLIFPNISGVASVESGDLSSLNGATYGTNPPAGTSNEEYTDEDAEKLQAETEALLAKMEDKTNKQKAKKDDTKDENKIVVDVQQGGRINPFVPSALFDENGFASFGADLSLPPDTSVDSPEAQAARKLMSIMVSGIMYDPEKPSAILKFGSMDYFVQAGDRIDDYIVLNITRDYVSIQNGANIYKAYVGETFKTEDYIPKNNQMFMEGNNRQYISANDIQISTK